MNTSAAPIGLKDRIVLLDILRGFAIFGILMVNMQIFYQPIILVQLGYSEPITTADYFSNIFIKFFFDGKFFMLFSILFGYGFYIFINKADKGGPAITRLFSRRLLILFFFGMLHVVLFWAGDILLIYALFGLALLLFRKVSDKGLLRWAAGLTLAPPVFIGLLALFASVALKVPEMAVEIQEGIEESTVMTMDLIEEASAAYATGEFAEMVEVRLREYQVMLIGVFSFYPVILGMFLVGYWAARRQIFKRMRLYKALFKKGLVWGAILGIPSSLIYIYASSKAPAYIPDAFTFLSLLTNNIGGFFMCLFYISALSLLHINGQLKNIGRLLAPVGRMALTNYLMQTVICTTLFFSYGFGLFGKINAFYGLLIACAVFVVQIPISMLWLSYFKYGPMEWVWRGLTYFQWQPIFKDSANQSPSAPDRGW